MLGKFFDKFCFNTLFLVAIVLVLAGLQLSSVLKKAEGRKSMESKPALPRAVGLWTRHDSPKVITAENIFDYMNGAGELYLGYRFDHCDVYEYKAPSQKEILVELYYMETSDDAFGLLSLDWGGEAMDLASAPSKTAPDDVLWPRALYGEGLLRLWSGNIYGRVMATQDTPESREAVLSIGQAIVKDRKNFAGPELMAKLPDSLLTAWTLRRDRSSFFRTHLVLNSLFYLSHQNILDLNLGCAAASAVYERAAPSGSPNRIQFLWVEYPDPGKAKTALRRFHDAYLPEHSFSVKPGASGDTPDIFAVEDGWMAYKWQNTSVKFFFKCPDKQTARAVIDQIE